MNKTRVMVTAGFLIALEIILTRFLSVQTPIVRVGFGFLPIAFSGIMFGPVVGGITGALSDIMGMMIFPQGAYFPGFTLTAFISGSIYGFFLHKKECSFMRVFITVLLIAVVCDLGLNTLWLSIITGKAVVALFAARLIKTTAMLPVQAVLIHMVWKGSYSLVKIRSEKKA